MTGLHYPPRSFAGFATDAVSYASFRYLSSTIVARRVLSFPRLVRGGAFAASASSAAYHSKAPIYSIMFRIVASLEQAWPASNMLIHMNANQDIELLMIYIASPCATIAVVARDLSRLGRKVLRILEWIFASISWPLLILYIR